MVDSAAGAGRRRKPLEKEQLSRDAWLDAAANAIAEGGFDNVRVLVLAKKLGVTRGSFYWHFKDHEDLVVSFLQRWRQRRLAELANWRPTGHDIEQELHRIMHLLLSESSRHLWRMRVELAVRDLARRDALAAQVVAEVDQARIEQNAQLLASIANDPSGAADLALLLYVATMGAQLVTTGPLGDTDVVGRIERLIANLVLDWHKRGGGDLLPTEAGSTVAGRGRADG
ncbi:MAG TPA: TetR/AcrR family transcriptional regulator [Gammaproteobacteria bacterium]|nr:TetR/AcrR family transcriptional regulator [Gammaproteobacteria bacterium]